VTAPEDPERLPVAGTVAIVRDASEGSPEGLEVLMLRRPDRGSFAGAWVFPGGKVEQGDRLDGADEAADAERAGIRETYEEVGLVVEGLRPLSQWQPPAEAPTRIRTWFFVAAASDAEPIPSAAEVVEWAWVSPAKALARHAAGEWILFPPTWVTLHTLSMFTDAARALTAARAAEIFRTRVIETAEGRAFSWEQGVLHAGRLPWRFVPAAGQVVSSRRR
jgi:8-oxo-dGTP pyrophosphatase MutT (NUDIX family)